MPLFRRLLATLLILTVGLGCNLGPHAMESSRLRYNEAVKKTSEEQLLLNIVRMRYSDSPSSLAIANIADQREIAGGLSATPFFTSAAAGDLGTYQGIVLPQGSVSGVHRPTLSFTPDDDLEFTRRLFTPMSLDGMAYLVRTTWPISTVFRLWLENLNWVSNAETASGPTPREPPEFADFLMGIEALQRLQDRRMVVLYHEERDEARTDGLTCGEGMAAAAVDAVRAGFEYRDCGDGNWRVMEKKPHTVLRIGQVPDNDSDFQTFCEAFHLDPARRSFDLTTDQLDPFLEGTPATGIRVVNLETRSLLQVLFFVAHGVDVPAEHLECGIAPATSYPDGAPFEWQDVLGGLFQVHCAKGRKPPRCAHTAIFYQGYWFYIDERDRDSKATFSLMMEVSRLELGTTQKTTPILTIPLGGP